MVSYDTKEQKVGVLSIPRDSIVDRDWSRNAKLNAALGHGGPELVAEEVTQMLGIPIDYYFHVNLQALWPWWTSWTGWISTSPWP